MRERRNVKTFSIFANRYFNLWVPLREEKSQLLIEWKLTSESCNTYNLYFSIEGIIPKMIIYNNHIPHHDATKNDS